MSNNNVTFLVTTELDPVVYADFAATKELQKPEPNMKRISGLMQKYFYAVALQGTMQVAILIVMTRFRTGI